MLDRELAPHGVNPTPKQKQEQVLQQLKEAVEEEKKKEKPKKRVFRGFKAILRAKAEGLAIETEVRYANDKCNRVSSQSSGLP